MSSIEVKNIGEAYNEQMLAILQQSPIHAGGLHICFDKQPDIFAASKMKYYLSKHVGLFVDGVLKGFGSVGYYDAWVGGHKSPVFYYHNFYVLPKARGRNFVYTAGKKMLGEEVDENIVGFAIALKGNKPAESYFNYPGAEGFKQVRVIEPLVIKSILFSIPKKNNTAYKVRNAKQEDVPAIVQLLQQENIQRLFGPVVTLESFLSNLKKRKGFEIENYFVAINSKGKLAGVCAAWDCASFRQTRVMRYSRNFWPDLLSYKALSALLPMAPLPKPGEYFKELTIIDYAVEGRDPAIMHALLCHIYNFYRGGIYHYINWGCCSSDPLLKASKGFWHKNSVSNIVLIAPPATQWPDEELRLPFVDIAFL